MLKGLIRFHWHFCISQPEILVHPAAASKKKQTDRRGWQSSHLPMAVANGVSSSNGNSLKKLWIDCDAGVDDAQGLVLALRSPGVQVLGISAVYGNVGVRQVVKNVARILNLCRVDLPYSIGCAEPLLGQNLDASFWHGGDGLGDVPETAPSAGSIHPSPAPGHACLNLVNAAREHAGDLRLVAIGPLTNIALACKLDPDLPNLVHSLTIMGGSGAGGNVTPTAEFNFHCDPEAAKLVFKKFSGRLTLVTWDCVLQHQLPWNEMERWLRPGRSRQADFLEAISRVGTAHDKKVDNLFMVCDPLAVAIAIEPDLVQDTQDVYADVELHGPLTRGQSVFDWKAELKKEANISVVKAVDMARVMQMLDASVTQ